MVGIVVVSHSEELAEGVVTLARQMAGPELKLVAAGGFAGAPGELGTDPERVRAAIEQAMSADGVLVLMDLGSALMSAQFAIELLGDTAGPVRLTAAPLVEGAVAAAVTASAGASLDEVATEAVGALAMKAGQIEDDAASGGPLATPAGDQIAAAASSDADLPVLAQLGLHARPAARLAQAVRAFDAEVLVRKAGSGTSAVNARSLTNLVSLQLRHGDTLEVSARGPQAQAAISALRELADGGFGDGVSDTPGGSVASGRGTATIADGTGGSRSLQPQASAVPAPGTVLRGVGASAGIATGRAYRIDVGAAGTLPDRTAESPGRERELLERAIAQARASLTRDRQQVATRAGEAQAEIFDAHAALLDDDALLQPTWAAIDAGDSAERAVHDASEQVAAVYRGLDDPLLAARAVDVLDVGQRVLAALRGDGDGKLGSVKGIVITDELTPTQAAGLDPERVRGIATARGSSTAHAAILARSLELPAVLGLGDQILSVADGTNVLLDGEAGTIVVEPDPALVSSATDRADRRRRRLVVARGRAHEQAMLRSGERIEVFANIGSVSDAKRAVELGAEGVGLLRTEFLFMDRDQLPDEDEQVAALTEIAQALQGRELIVRTLDAGADKPLRSLPMAPEVNPFLGLRGIRVGLVHPDLLLTQLRAVVRVAAEYPLKVMFPMVATPAELGAATELLTRACVELHVQQVPELGITLEVPSAALLASNFASQLEFFSFGTNDLTQYTMAAERGAARLAPLLAAPQPAVLRLIKMTVDAALAASAQRGRGCWVGVCGEMAGDPASAVLLAGLGVTELSVAPALVAEIKQTLRQISLSDASTAALAALDVDDAQAARALALALL